MKIELSEKSCEQIAQQVAIMLKSEQPAVDGEYVSTREAAEILRVSPDRMRRLKDKFPHVKIGLNGQGKLLFLKSSLVQSYSEN